MNTDLVKAARLLGGSILLGSTMVAASLCWVHRDRTIPATITSPSPAPSRADPIKKDEGVTTVRLGNNPVYPTHPMVPRVDSHDVGPDPTSCLNPPTEQEVLEKLNHASDRRATSPEPQRRNVRIQIEKIGERVDPCKVYPLTGVCQLVHCHYKCSVYFDESFPIDSPIPVNQIKARVEVVFIDKDHLQRCGGSDTPSPSSSTVKP